MSKFFKNFRFSNLGEASLSLSRASDVSVVANQFSMENVLEQNECYRRELLAVLRELRSHASANVLLYGDSEDAIGQRFYSSFVALHDHVSRSGLEPAIDYILGVVHLFDLDPSVPGNGYRSMVTVINRCCLRLIALVRHIEWNKNSYLFRAQHYSKELEAYVAALGQLRACMHYLVKLIPFCPGGRLFPDEEALAPEDYVTAGKLLEEVEALCQECFYGRCLGFQFCDSMSGPLTMINLILASYSDGYEKSSVIGKLASSFMSSQRYAMDPELKAKRIVEATRNGNVNFCKAFWGLAENPILHRMPQFICPSVALDRVMLLDPEELSVPLADGSGCITVHPPCAHSGPGSVSVRLISASCRVGQVEEGSLLSSKVLPMSDGLILHVHGGGFVAQSSASHQVYLRHWAQDIGVPILSVDYSLAPEHPYPRQLEEVFYAYCWALTNSSRLGWNGKKICIVGDSAGATLAMGAALNIITYAVKQPSGILSVYGCLLVKYAPSPSRILSIMDPLLPIGVLPKCLSAYCGVKTEIEMNEIQRRGSSNSSIKSEKSVDNTYMNASAHNPIQSQDSVFLPNSPPVNLASGDFRLTDRVKRFTNESTGIYQSVSENVFGDMTGNMKDDLPYLACNKNSEITAADNLESTIQPADRITSVDSHISTLSDVSALCNGYVSDSYLEHSSSRPTEVRNSTAGGSTSEHRKRESSIPKTASSPAFLTPPQSPFEQAFVSAASSPTSLSGARSSFTESNWIPSYAKTYSVTRSKFGEFQKVSVGSNPLMSPLLASDEVLKALCPIFLLTCHMDPMLDDSVAFAKRLRKLGKFVHLDIVDGLPHGFLNFVLLSAEAKAASTLCTMRLRHILDIDKNYTNA